MFERCPAKRHARVRIAKRPIWSDGVLHVWAPKDKVPMSVAQDPICRLIRPPATWSADPLLAPS
eukprot:772175-Prorocentrum_minimum.AAC.1